ncbi:MAG: chemotaxis protein CheD [Deltaproteobacteria bacterium]|nr:chemotaxis protein CheD [Deltaproteobacteria bacterium]MBW2017232.1 chemotaxis protein CheD [Deltaproteobacteria bacterium]
MEGELLLKTGELAIGEGQDVLCTRGVGSCIVTCLWDRKRVLGGMAHIPRPAASEEDAATREWSAVSPEMAIPRLLRMMRERGARRDRISVRIAGGGNMFPVQDCYFMCDIGKEILENTRSVVSDLGLWIAGESVGGPYGRSVFFDVAAGTVQVFFTNGDMIEL